MKKIEAIIHPFKLEDAKVALGNAGVHGVTVSEVKGYGRQKGQAALYRGAEYVVDLLPKVKIELVVLDEMAEKIVAELAMATRSGRMGDGKVFVSSVEQAYRIRTGERGENALL